jgi:carboxyl-terminal processing protease
LSDDSALKVTVAKWLTPKGHSISEQGLEPDVVVSQPDRSDETKKGKDVQFEKAMEIIKK